MVRLLTLTTIFLSSLAAFTMADTNADLAAPPKPDDLFTLVKSAQAVYRGFIALYDVFDQPKEGIKTAAFYHTAYKAVMTIDQHFNRSQMASELTKDPDFIHFGNYADLGALRNVYNRTYGVDGNAQKACQKLSEAAPELKAFEKDDQARADADRIVKPGARIADAIEMLMQDHGELVYDMAKSGNPGIASMIHWGTPTLLDTYNSLDSGRTRKISRGC